MLEVKDVLKDFIENQSLQVEKNIRIMLEHEGVVVENPKDLKPILDSLGYAFERYEMPGIGVIYRLLKEGKIKSEFSYKTNIDISGEITKGTIGISEVKFY
jgi:hypothetical protein